MVVGDAMENIVISILGVIIGALITYFFNILIERKSLRNKVYMDIYEQIIKYIDKSSKSAKDIKLSKISNELEAQYKRPNNYGEILNKIDCNIKNIFRVIQLKINDLIDFNLYLNYHRIPLEKYKDIINRINTKSFEIIEIIKMQQVLYNSTVIATGYIKIDDETWNYIMQNEEKLEKNINEYLEEIMNFSDKIQKDYYKNLLKLK